jgi:single-strand DNA-binding protein
VSASSKTQKNPAKPKSRREGNRMKTVNRVTLMGCLGKDPDIRSTAGGKLIANMSIATTEREKDTNGKWQDRAEWHNVVAFERTAEIVRDYLKKGAPIYVEGRLHTRVWDDQESGEKRSRTEILVDELIMLRGATAGSKNGGAQ